MAPPRFERQRRDLAAAETHPHRHSEVARGSEADNRTGRWQEPEERVGGRRWWPTTTVCLNASFTGQCAQRRRRSRARSPGPEQRWAPTLRPQPRFAFAIADATRRAILSSFNQPTDDDPSSVNMKLCRLRVLLDVDLRPDRDALTHREHVVVPAGLNLVVLPELLTKCLHHLITRHIGASNGNRRHRPSVKEQPRPGPASAGAELGHVGTLFVS